MDNTVSLFDVSVSPWTMVLDLLRSESNDFGMAILDAVGYEGVDNGCVYLTVPDKFRETWLVSHYGELLKRAFTRVLGNAFNEFRIRLLAPSPEIPEIKLTPNLPPVEVQNAIRRVAAAPMARPKLPLYPQYTFDNFIAGECNSTALRACLEVAEHPGDKAMNLLLVYGASGLGKTHLLHAIASKILADRPSAKIVYRQAYDFVRDFTSIAIAASKGDKARGYQLLDRFRERYEECDVLLIDDIQLLEKAVQSQDRLVLLIRQLQNQGKQVVLSSDRHPSAFSKGSSDAANAADGSIPKLSAGLLSAIENCVGVGLSEPDLQTRMDLVRHKSRNLPFAETDREEICRYLSMQPRANVRLIEGMLNWLMAMHTLNGVDLTLCCVKQIVAPASGEHTAALTLKTIAETVAVAFNVDLTVLSSKRQDLRASLPRKVAMFLCRELTQESLQNVGRAFNRDYATVIASINSLNALMIQDTSLNRRVKDLRYMLES